MARYPNFDPKRAALQRLGEGRLQSAARGALERPRRRLHPCPARRRVGRHALRHHRQGTGQQGHLRRRLAEQPPDGHARQSASWRTSSRNWMRPASGSSTARPARCTSTRRRASTWPRRPSKRVRLRHLVEFRGTEQAPVRFVTLQGPDLPPRRAHLHGQQGTAGAQRLDHLPRRRALLHGHGRLLDGGLLHRPGGRQRRLREQLQPPGHRARLPHRQGRRPTAWRSSATATPRECRATGTTIPSRSQRSTARPARRPTTTRPTASWTTA